MNLVGWRIYCITLRWHLYGHYQNCKFFEKWKNTLKHKYFVTQRNSMRFPLIQKYHYKFKIEIYIRNSNPDYPEAAASYQAGQNSIQFRPFLV